MNLFILDQEPTLAAMYHDDLRVPKMVLETAQMAATALILHGAPPPPKKDGSPYSISHKNHPCSVWMRKTKTNFLWALELATHLLHEYGQRFGKRHGCTDAIRHCLRHSYALPEGPQTPFVLAMPDQFKGPDPVQAYRDYYRSKNVRYNRAPAPGWWQ